MTMILITVFIHSRGTECDHFRWLCIFMILLHLYW